MWKKLKSILSNGIPWGLTFFVGSFLLGHYLFHGPFKASLIMSLIIGGLALLVNGSIYGRFAKPEKVLNSINIQLNNAEELVFQSSANHLINESLIPGKLCLTTERLFFKPYKVTELALAVYEWPVSEVVPYKFYGSLWNQGGEFLMRFGNDQTLMFEVNQLNDWKKLLKIEQVYKNVK